MIHQNLVANVLLDESKGHNSPGVGDLIAIWSHDFGQIPMFPFPDELLSLDLSSRYTSRNFSFFLYVVLVQKYSGNYEL